MSGSEQAGPSTAKKHKSSKSKKNGKDGKRGKKEIQEVQKQKVFLVTLDEIITAYEERKDKEDFFVPISTLLAKADEKAKERIKRISWVPKELPGAQFVKSFCTVMEPIVRAGPEKFPVLEELFLEKGILEGGIFRKVTWNKYDDDKFGSVLKIKYYHSIDHWWHIQIVPVR